MEEWVALRITSNGEEDRLGKGGRREMMGEKEVRRRGEGRDFFAVQCRAPLRALVSLSEADRKWQQQRQHHV